MNRIPKTEISVSPVTLGTMTFGSPVAFDDAVKLTQYALSRGINHIDTANMYEGYNRVAGSAGGVAEEIVGAAIRGRARGSVIVFILANAFSMTILPSCPVFSGDRLAPVSILLPQFASSSAEYAPQLSTRTMRSSYRIFAALETL